MGRQTFHTFVTDIGTGEIKLLDGQKVCLVGPKRPGTQDTKSVVAEVKLPRG